MHGNLQHYRNFFGSESSNDDDEPKHATGPDEKKRKKSAGLRVLLSEKEKIAIALHSLSCALTLQGRTKSIL